MEQDSIYSRACKKSVRKTLQPYTNPTQGQFGVVPRVRVIVLKPSGTTPAPLVAEQSCFA